MTTVGRLARRVTRRATATRPSLSVVVLVRGDPGGLDAYVERLLGPSCAAGEVLLVAEPGDRRAEAAVRRAAARRRVRAVEAPEAEADPWVAAGTHARADRVMFLAAGDVVPPGAMAAMSSALEGSGSDVVVGRSRPGRRRGPGPAPEVASARGVPLADVPAAVVDPEPTGKLFRADLWRRAAAVGPGPAEAVTVRALLLASALDVVDEVVHERHDRQGDLPVAERDRFQVDGVRARTAAWRAVSAELATAPEPVRDAWLVGLLTCHVWPLCHDAVAAGEGFAAVLGDTAREVLAQMSPSLLARVPLAARLAGVAAAEAPLGDLALLLDLLADHPHGLPTEVLDDGRAVARLPVAGRYLTSEVRTVRDVDRVLRSRVSLHPVDGGLEVLGAAFVTYAPDSRPELVLVPPEGGPRPLVPERRVDPAIDEWAGRSHEPRAGSGFRAVLDAVDSSDTRPWTVEVRLAGRVARHRQRLDAGCAADVLVEGLEVAAGQLVLALCATGSRLPASARLVGGKAATEPVAVSWSGQPGSGQYGEVALPLTHDLFGVPALLPAGGYALEMRSADGSATSVAVAASRSVPPEVVAERLRVQPRPAPRGVRLLVGAPLDAAARSAFGQRRMLDESYATARRRARAPRTVLLESFRGGSVGDNPGAVGRALAARTAAEELDLDLAYVVDDPSVVVPDGARAVVRRTAAWYGAMGSAAAYVSNAGAPYWFEKAPGQLHVQTWHGTPLKRIGEHRGAGDFATWRHRRRLAAQAAGWDAMVSSGGYVSEIYRGAFGFTGTVLEVGYPRNDVLLAAGADRLRERVRARLGLEPHHRVVLYAPTWREHVGVKDAKPLFLDAEQVTAALPDAVVLVRGHYNSLRQDDVLVGRPRVRDVTRYPDIADLFLAADALVTDYSSVMFDFALTDRPQVLLVPDLDRYRDVERGFYLDLERQHPGPLVATTGEVVDVLAGPDRHAAARAAFRRDFCPLEDGRASERVADFVLERL